MWYNEKSIHFEKVLDRMKPMTKKEGVMWGLEHLRYVNSELKKLEQKTLAKDDDGLYDEVRASLIHSKDVETELQTKLRKIN